jgi:hypothetical protein
MMLASVVRHPILVARKDRRAARTPLSDILLIDGEPMEGRDISATGVSVFVRPTFARGDVVRVTLAGTPGAPDEIGTSARVARIDACGDGFVVGLKFIE